MSQRIRVAPRDLRPWFALLAGTVLTGAGAIGCSSRDESAAPDGQSGSAGAPQGGRGGSVPGSGGAPGIGGAAAGAKAVGGTATSGGASGAPSMGGGMAELGGMAGVGGQVAVAGAAGAAGSAGAVPNGGTGGAGGAGGAAGGTTSPPIDVGTGVVVDASGKYSVTFKRPAWTFGGTLGVAATAITTTIGSDKLGAYSETTFSYVGGTARQARIRAYTATPVVVFAEKNPAAGSNTRQFPRLSAFPSLPHHLTYSNTVFGQYTLSTLTADSPWVYFDNSANAFILSGASNFMNIETRTETDGAISTGISRSISSLPAGFEQSTVLVADTGINGAYDKWGSALQRFGGKEPIANDAYVELEKLGYWTDNGASYYYATQSGADYRTTLLRARDYLVAQSIPAGYVQLDSWWYPKGAVATWEGSGTNRGGTHEYVADSTLFPQGLATFQTSLALPLMTHNRWIDAASPYRSQFTMSRNVSTDPAFWNQIAAYLKSSGVVSYEQDWLNDMALPATDNLTDQNAFMDNMARAMAAAGITIQYCMPLARHYLQSTKYQNVVTSRVSNDKFARNRWLSYLYGSRLASAVGEWPWSDVFKSNDLDSLRLSLLSAGIFGLGDAINGVTKANVAQAVRTDGVIVKPDVPIVPLDRAFVSEASGNGPMVATTYSAHPGGRTTYLVAFSDASATLAFTPAELGYAGDIYVYDANRRTGRLTAAAATYTDPVAATGSAYYVIAPVGKSGIAFLGDAGKFASTGKKRVSSFMDDGVVTATLVFSAGETATLHGYAAAAPTVAATSGTVGPVTYDASNKRFTVLVTPAAGAATVKIMP